MNWTRRGLELPYAFLMPTIFFYFFSEILVYETQINLVAMIIIAAGENQGNNPSLFESVRQSFIRRCALCNEVHWRRFKELLQQFCLLYASQVVTSQHKYMLSNECFLHLYLCFVSSHTL
ncbi:hypothetical protein CEXT_636271 [Caerostris extrusa]|uniref:Uncharacterized protein n=1 Tax=Caerostris extrusa TaxID=172846 RepID=A0AAV4M3G6_CAEEX|nr:hypothetical protein CEXT_636271 [Caerostris extrusa]